MTRVVLVEIAGQQYPIRSALDDGYVATLAAYVEQKMRAASDVAPTSDTGRGARPVPSCWYVVLGIAIFIMCILLSSSRSSIVGRAVPVLDL